jgi:hypothetical protein
MKLTYTEINLILYLSACPISRLSDLSRALDRHFYDISTDILRLKSLGFVKVERDGARPVFSLLPSTDPIETKRCPKCKKDKPLADFGTDRARKDNKKPHCKQCQSEYAKSPKGRAARQRWLDNGGVEKLHFYQQSDKGRADRLRANAAYGKRNSQKIRAVAAVTRAVGLGKMPRAAELDCSHCPDSAQEYHHPDYDEPLQVVALCRLCHRDLHLQGGKV